MRCVGFPNLTADVMSRFDHHTLIDEVSINNNSNPTFKKKRGGRCAIFTGFFLAMHMFIDTPFTHLSQVVDHSKVQNPSIQAEESANNFLKVPRNTSNQGHIMT